MGHRCSQLNMPKSFAPDLGLDYLYTALFTDHTTVFDALILAAITLIILYRSENLGTEQAISFRLESPVVYGLRFFTSPWDQSRILPGEAREILTELKLTGFLALAKKLNSSSTSAPIY